MSHSSEIERVQDADGGVVLTNAKFKCTNCKKWKGARAFGLRTMKDGTIRNQSQCIACRGGAGLGND